METSSESVTLGYNVSTASMETSSESVTLGYNVSTANCESSTSVDVWAKILSVLLAITIPVCLFGNLLVLIAFVTNKKVRRLNFNLYILNLALTDVTVAATAMPLYFIDFTFGYWPFGEYICGLWIFLDWGLTFASIFNLVAISIDRFWAVQFSSHYKQKSSRRNTVLAICLIWVCLLIMWVPPFLMDRIRYSEPGVCIWAVENNREFILFIAVAGYHGPSLVMIFCYIKVFVVMRQSKLRVGPRRPAARDLSGTTVSQVPSQSTLQVRIQSGQESSAETPSPSQVFTITKATKKQKSQTRDHRIFVSLTYIIAAYLLCWSPFHIMFDIMYADDTGTIISGNWYAFGIWMAYVNSTLNPILYACGNPDFFTAFKNILSCKCFRK